MSDKENLLEIRKEIFLTAYSASIAHIASAFSIAEILYVLYEKKFLNYDPKDCTSENRDIFILSKGHGSLALYTELCRVGFFDKDVLKTFAKPGSILGGEPVIDIPGVEVATGSLGHGLSIGTGIALSKKIDDRKEKVYVILGDGECEEGTIWEAVMFACHQKLDNLIIIVDANNIQKMDRLENVMSIKSWKDKFSSFGCHVMEIDGHNIEQIENSLQNIKKDKVNVILAHTIKGKGVSIIENDPRWHWRLPNKRELKTFMAELNISEEEIEGCKKHI